MIVVGPVCYLCDASLTFHAAAARLQHPGVHVHPGLGHELVPHQVGVVGGGDEVVAEGPVHVLVHLVVLGTEDVPRRAAHVVGEALGFREGLWLAGWMDGWMDAGAPPTLDVVIHCLIWEGLGCLVWVRAEPLFGDGT